jgi:hypothetical protein
MVSQAVSDFRTGMGLQTQNPELETAKALAAASGGAGLLQLRESPMDHDSVSSGRTIVMADPVAQIALIGIVDASRLLLFSRHDHHAAALETCAAAL